MSNVIGIRLISGEDVIAKIENLGTKIKLIKPAIFGMTQGPDGRAQPGLADYLPMADKKEIIIDEKHILFQYDLKIELYNAYTSMFGSGLVIPKYASALDFTKPLV